MTVTPRRTPTGAAVLQAEVTAAIKEAILDGLATHGYARLSMEAVAKSAGVGKSALYRRWPSKQEMVMSFLSEFSVPLAQIEDTGSFRTDLSATLRALYEWLTHPHFSQILPDLTAEACRNEELAAALRDAIGEPRRALGVATLHRAIDRGELPPDLDIELALDLLAAPIYWRLTVRHATTDPDYLDHLAELIHNALRAKERMSGGAPVDRSPEHPVR